MPPCKTEHLFMGSVDNLNKIENTSPIHINGKVIRSVNSTKCLGVQIDQKLSWTNRTCGPGFKKDLSCYFWTKTC